jgi:hypothetical protein
MGKHKPTNYALHRGARRRHNMRAVFRWIKGSRRRKIGAAVTVASLALAGGALAFYLISLTGSGSGSTTLGQATTANVPLYANLPMNLTPGQSNGFGVQFGTDANHPPTGLTASADYSVPSLTVASIVTNPSQCASDLSVSGIHGVNPVTSNSQPLPETVTGAQIMDGDQFAQGTLSFTDDGTDQTACAGASVTVNLTIP